MKKRFWPFAVMAAISPWLAHPTPAPAALPPLEEAAGITYADISTYALCTDNLRLRSTQSLSADTIVVMPKGTKVMIANVGEEFSVDGIDSRWCRVVSESGMDGWCFGGYLKTLGSVYGSAALSARWKIDAGSDCAYSPSGDRIALKEYGVKGNGDIRIVDVVSGKTILEHEASSRVTTDCVAWSPDGRSLYYSVESTLYSLDVATNAETSLGSPLTEYGEVTNIEVSDDGTYVVCGYRANNQATALYSIAAGTWKLLASPGFMWPLSYAFDSSGTRVAGCATNSAMISVWDTKTGKRLWTNDYCGSGHLCFSPDGTSLYVCSYYSVVTLDAKTGDEKKTVILNMPSKWYRSCGAFTADRKTAILSVNGSDYGDGTESLLCVFDLGTSTLSKVFDLPGKTINNIAVDTDGSAVCVTSFTGNVTENETRTYDLKIGAAKAAEKWVTAGLKTSQYAEYVRNHSYGVDVLDWFYLSFDANGLYHLSSRHYGEETAPYSVSGKTVRLFPLASDAQKRVNDWVGEGRNVDVSGTWTIDDAYADFFREGRLVMGSRAMISYSDSPAGKRYTFEGVECVKLPWDSDGNDRYVSLKSNMTMRRKPSVSAEKIHLMRRFDGGYVKDRTIVYEDSYYLARAKSVKVDTIDGITSCWYLITEFGDIDDYDPQSEWVWVFGGYVTEFGEDELPKYEQLEKENLVSNIIATGNYELYEME